MAACFSFFFFLVADTRIRDSTPCRVGRSVRPSVTFLNCERFWHYCPCLTVCDCPAECSALLQLRPLYSDATVPLSNSFRDDNKRSNVRESMPGSPGRAFCRRRWRRGIDHPVPCTRLVGQQRPRIVHSLSFNG